MATIYKIFELGTYFRLNIVPTNVYYIDTIPTEVKPEFVVLIAFIAVFLSCLPACSSAPPTANQTPTTTATHIAKFLPTPSSTGSPHPTAFRR